MPARDFLRRSATAPFLTPADLAKRLAESPWWYVKWAAQRVRVSVHKVRSGESVASISKKYKTQPIVIRDMNNLGSDSLAEWLRRGGWTVEKHASQQGFRVLRVTRNSRDEMPSRQPNL